jgi:hypothetical protein
MCAHQRNEDLRGDNLERNSQITVGNRIITTNLIMRYVVVSGFINIYPE